MSLHYNGSDSFLCVNATKIYKFNAKGSEIKKYLLCLGNVLKNFTINNMKKKGLKENVNFYSVDYRSTNTNKILDIYKWLMKESL